MYVHNMKKKLKMFFCLVYFQYASLESELNHSIIFQLKDR